MIIIDESERVRTMVEAALVGPRPERPGRMEILREFSHSVAKAAEDELFATGDVGKAIAAAVTDYQRERQNLIAYRLRNRLPVTNP